MSLADEISRLNELKGSGALTEEEFLAAKAKLIAETTPPPTPPTLAASSGINVNQWCMFIHFSQFAGYIIPFAGLVAPIIIWQMKKDESPIIDRHGKIVVNWIITAVIGFAICFVLAFVLIGIPLMVILGIVSVVFGVIGGIKAGNGEAWDYPMTIRFIK
jgi:uncharacterized Tic20 family protein